MTLTVPFDAGFLAAAEPLFLLPLGRPLPLFAGVEPSLSAFLFGATFSLSGFGGRPRFLLGVSTGLSSAMAFAEMLPSINFFYVCC